MSRGVNLQVRQTKAGTTRYRASVYDSARQKQINGPWSGTRDEAKAWRIQKLADLQNGSGTAAKDRGPTLDQAVLDFLDAARHGRPGATPNGNGAKYKPSVIDSLDRHLNNRIIPEFGGSTRLSEIERHTVQRYIEQLAEEDGLAPSTTRNIINALRTLWKWADRRWRNLGSDPTAGVRHGSGAEARCVTARPVPEAAALVAALPSERDRALYGLSVYAGLRIGESLGLDWSLVDLDGLKLRVEQGYDGNIREFIDVKTTAAERTVPIVAPLAKLLRDLPEGEGGRSGLLFPRPHDPSLPVSTTAIRRNAKATWEAAGLDPAGFHELRHTAASLWIDAGLNAKTVSTLIGHASITFTFDKYGHLFPGSEEQAREDIDRYLAENA